MILYVCIYIYMFSTINSFNSTSSRHIKVNQFTGRYFKFIIDAIKGPNITNGVELSEIGIYYNGIQISNSGITVTALDNYTDVSQLPPKIFDNDVNTKWFSNTVNNTVLFTYPSNITLNQYNYSSSDASASFRFPVSWRLYGSVDNVTFKLLDQQTNYPIVTTGQTPNTIIKLTNL
jgi:hypothetical protein